MIKKRVLQYKVINGRKCERFKDTTTWQVCEVQS